ncbi:MAG: hypothetical protein IAF00_05480 [Phycisphaerales bacterium]|nr:hypothetical protein [Phycisphaerales bacterium]
MKNTLITVSSLALLLGAGVALAQWNKGDGNLPPFEEVDTNQDGMVSMEEAKAHPGMVTAVTKGNTENNVEESIKSFFSVAHQQNKDKPYDSPITKEEWQSLTAK